MLGSPYKCGYKWSNGLPMTDKFHDMLEKFYDYAKAQGDTRSKKEVYAHFENLLMKTAGINKVKALKEDAL